MNPRRIGSYFFASIIYLTAAAALFGYKLLVRNQSVGIEHLLSALGQSGLILTGLFLNSKLFFKKTTTSEFWAQSVDIGGRVGVSAVIVYELASIPLLLNKEIYQLFSVDYIMRIFFVFGFLLITAFLVFCTLIVNLDATIKKWAGLATIILFLVTTIPVALSNWTKWIAVITAKGDNSVSMYLLPTSTLITLFAIASIVVFALTSKYDTESISSQQNMQTNTNASVPPPIVPPNSPSTPPVTNG